MQPPLALAALLLLSATACTSTLPAPTSPSESTPSIEVIALRYAVASEVVDLVQELVAASEQAARVQREHPERRGNGVTVRPLGPGLRVVADARTNSVVVQGTAADLTRMKELITLLDTKVLLYDSASR